MMNRKGFTLIELMIVIAIIGILAAMAMPNFKTSRWQARQKACYSNIRVIQGAVEMYNMDVSGNDMLSQLNGDLGALSGYIKNPTGLVCPEYGSGKYKGSSLSNDGEVMCGDEETGSTVTDMSKSAHGNLSGPKKA